ncbi:MAG: dihydropteroate synthase [Stenomitos rutilans HA7619-LM2]|jgi:dihydropteroate synthase|nr:dihydropteroate synthase [Stenomitos rutilans HA7619-LM2]
MSPTVSPLLPWTIRSRSFDWGDRTYLMGVLNVTPDSFSDGGLFNSLETAIVHARTLVAAGADILDVGGQSTRPNAVEVSLDEELHRVVPIIEQIRQETDIPLSIDTTRAAVAQAAIAAGADIVNDISGATYDADMLPAVAALNVPLILMHLRGTPQTMQQLTEYGDVVEDIRAFLNARLEAAIACGVDRASIAIDPGIGFAKTYQQNLEILRRLPELRSLTCPLLVGASRKSFIGHILNQPSPKERVWGTAAACSAAIAGGADILRVHDVRELKDVCQVADAIFRF